MAEMKQETAAQEFKDAAAAASHPRVTLEIDADLADWLKSQFRDWHGHANDLLRFYMETSQTREMQVESDEMREPPPAPPPAP